METEGIGALGDFHHERIISALRGIVLSQLGTQAARLDPDHGIHVRIEIFLAAEDFCRDLILLGGCARMFQGMMGQIAEKLAKRLRAMKGVARQKFVDLCELKRFLSHGDHRAGDCNTKVTLAHLFVKAQLNPRNRIRLLETYVVTQKTDRRHHKYTLTLVWVSALPSSGFVEELMRR
jgi:hypothetical protein